MEIQSSRKIARKVTEYNGKDKRTLEVGQTNPKADRVTIGGIGERVGETARDLFLPQNYPNSVSKDYTATRAWWFARDVFSNAVGYCSGAAIGSALGIHPVWGGAGMASFNMIRDRTSQTVGFASSFLTPTADKNPRPWIVTGELLESAGMTLETAAASYSDQLLPIALSASVIRVVAGAMKGAWMANIGPRQAISDNLGEVGAKNGNQGFVASLLGAGIGMAAHSALSSAIGTGPASTLIAAVGSVGAIFSTSMMVNSLNMNPVNETAIDRLAESLDKNGEVVKPFSSVWRELPSMARFSQYPMGLSVEPLLKDEKRFKELEQMYSGRKYMMDIVDDEPYVVLAQDSQAADRFQAALQCAFLTRLKKNDETLSNKELVEQSLAKTPGDAVALLERMEKAGWSTDMVRVDDSGIRVDWKAGGQDGSEESKTS